MGKSFRFGFVLTLEERQMIEKLALSEGGLSKAALIRRLIRQAAFDKGVWQPEGTSKRPNEYKAEGKGNG